MPADTIVINAVALLRIGDFLGTMPATCARAELGPVELYVHPSARACASMIPKRYGVEIIACDEDVYADYTYELTAASRVSTAFRPLYMTQSFFRQVRLPMPAIAPRPELELDESRRVSLEGDVGLAPFARSLAPDEFWPKDRWQQLVDRFPAVRFVLYGVEGVDDAQYVIGPNVTPFFGYSVEQAVLSIRDLRTCLVSVVTGLSHVAFAVNQPNIVFSGQGPWGNQPDGIRIAGPVNTLPVNTVVDELERVLAGDRDARVVEQRGPGEKPPIVFGARVNRLIPGLNAGMNVWIDGFGMVPNDVQFLCEGHFKALGLML